MAEQKGEPMNDLISRQVAIEDVKSWVAVDGREKHLQKDVIEWLKVFPPSAQPEQRWIPCRERLPFAECGESNNVLATCGYRDGEDTSIRWIRTLYFNGGCWCYPTGETYDQKVYAWMPLPEPYKGGEQDG